jgi:hypothetical protein|nr:MAG TPA: hypothetical protein [Caudoviricetes sp.]
MKTKLLKKIRKRYEINYYPNGYDFGSGYETSTACVALIDTRFWTFEPNPVIEIYFVDKEFNKDWAFNCCLNSLSRLIVNKYDKYGTRRNKKSKQITEKLWHKP